jgi:hypothetical protein
MPRAVIVSATHRFVSLSRKRRLNTAGCACAHPLPIGPHDTAEIATGADKTVKISSLMFLILNILHGRVANDEFEIILTAGRV